jgi:hypothetical protein
MAFPTSPVNGQQATINGIVYTYSTTLTAWTVTTGSGPSFVSISVTGNVTSGNILNSGLISATGNVTGNYILGNGALLSGVSTSSSNINLGTSNITVVSSGGNITTSVGGTSNVVVWATTGEYITGVVSAVGNITGGNVLTGGLVSAAGTITGTSYLGAVVSVTGNITGGNILTSGIVSATGNVTGNNISTTNAFVTKTILETATINASAFANPTTYDILTQSVWYSTANASTNFTLNIRGNSSVTANALMSVGQSMSFALLVTNGATPYYPSAYQVDGTTITPKYLGGTAISSGNANSVDVYTYTLIKTAATPTYTLLATQSKFA